MNFCFAPGGMAARDTILTYTTLLCMPGVTLLLQELEKMVYYWIFVSVFWDVDRNFVPQIIQLECIRRKIL